VRAMSPSTLEAHLTECVYDSLSRYLVSNAIFLCERLYACSASEANAHLLATCYFRAGQAYRAYAVLKRCTSAQCRYLLALCCHSLGKLAEAERALQPEAPTKEDADARLGAAELHLLGLICRQTDRREMAVVHFCEALTLDPFLWSAYEELCGLGAEEQAAACMDSAHLHLGSLPSAADMDMELMPPPPPPVPMPSQVTPAGAWGTPADTPLTAQTPVAPPSMATPAATPRSRSGSLRSGTVAPLPMQALAPTPAATLDGVSSSTPASVSFVTPSPVGKPGTAPSMPPPPPKLGGGERNGDAGESIAAAAAAAERSGGLPSGVSPAPTGGGRRKFVDEGKMRKVSGRLFSEAPQSLRRSSRLSQQSAAATAADGNAEKRPPNAPGKHSAGAATGGGGSDTAPGTAEETPANVTHSIGTGAGALLFAGGGGGGGGVASAGTAGQNTGFGKTIEGAEAALALLRTLGEGYRLLCVYRCQEATEVFQRLPADQYATGWVLTMMGRAYAEMVDYAEAERAFAWARRVCPHRLAGMEVYSTVLWHLKKEVELSYLAQEAIALDRLAPQTWCIMGNCFSLQKEHETALRFFSRALQVDPNFTYAHTLCGHEYFANEDFEKGIGCYRAALRIDARHYNAWYGLGTIYFRQEKYDLSEYHFRRALQINMRSSVLYCYLGMALHALKRNSEALMFLETAIGTDPRNALAKFQRASVLMSCERFQEALVELESLQEMAPREASVFFLMGRIHKKLLQPDRAMINFSIALDLKPSSSDVNLIKSAIEKLNVPDDLEEEELPP